MIPINDNELHLCESRHLIINSWFWASNRRTNSCVSIESVIVFVHISCTISCRKNGLQFPLIWLPDEYLIFLWDLNNFSLTFRTLNVSISVGTGHLVNHRKCCPNESWSSAAKIFIFLASSRVYLYFRVFGLFLADF